MKKILAVTLAICILAGLMMPLALAHGDDNATRDAEGQMLLRYIPTIDKDMKANLRGIMAVGADNGRVPGVLGQWGDSITDTKAYMGDVQYAPVVGGHDYTATLIWMNTGLTGNAWSQSASYLRTHKGAEYGNQSGWTTGSWISQNGGGNAIINKTNPSWAVIMLGTNDLNGSADPAGFKERLFQIVDTAIEAGVIPVLSTIPPRGDDQAADVSSRRVTNYNIAIRDVAASRNIPCIDFYGLLLEAAAPDGLALIHDGVHPSADPSYLTPAEIAAGKVGGGQRLRSLLTLEIGEKLKMIVFEDGKPDAGPVVMCTVSGTIKDAYKKDASTKVVFTSKDDPTKKYEATIGTKAVGTKLAVTYTATIPQGEYSIKASMDYHYPYNGSVTVDAAAITFDPKLRCGSITGGSVVNIDDLIALLGKYKKTVAADPEAAKADLDGSGKVDIDDLIILLGNYKKGPITE